jgi:hypothetical protein
MEPLPELVTTRRLPSFALSRTALRSVGYRRDMRGLYVADWADDESPEHRITRAALLAGPDTTIGGWAAAHVHELRGRPAGDDLCVFDGRAAYGGLRPQTPVLLLMPPEKRARPARDRQVFRSRVLNDERETWGDVTITSPLRTAFDLARLSRATTGVVFLDRLLSLGLVGFDDLNRLIAERRAWRGAARAARILRLAEDRVRSPMETIMRLEWLRAQLPRPWCNAEIEDLDGRFVAMVDLLDEATGLVGEYDGGHHAGADRRRLDAIRRERTEAAGLTTVTMTAVDASTAENRAAWRRRLLAAHERAGRRPRGWRLRGR